MNEPLMCSCGRPAEVDIHCQNCFYEGAYSGHLSLIMGPDPEPQRVGIRWPSNQQIHEAERRAQNDLDAMIEAEKQYG